MHRQAPNALSITRIAGSFILIVVYSGSNLSRYLIGLGVIAMLIITDVLDGYIARRFDLVSELGYILDGLGDRAAYAALVLTFVAHNDVNLALAWLLIFREIAIYAFRLIDTRWYNTNPPIRHLSRWHAAGIRLWFLSYLISDGLRLTLNIDIGNHQMFRLAQVLMSLFTVIISYYGLYRILVVLISGQPTHAISRKQQDRPYDNS